MLERAATPNTVTDSGTDDEAVLRKEEVRCKAPTPGMPVGTGPQTSQTLER